MTYKKTIFLTFLWFCLTLTGGSITVFLGAHLYLSPSLPSVDSLRDIRLQTPLRIYSNDNKLIEEIGEKRRTPVKFHEVPEDYINALLSAEDADFFSHNGVSIKGLMRAASQLLMSGNIRGGGSTITMQVARNYFLNKRQEFKRKFNEILLALRIERELTKEEIFELYVNVIFLGNRAYGIQAAAQVYYGKPLSQLNLPQLAMLAGLPKAPSRINPLADHQRALQRRNWILGRMHVLQKITTSAHSTATKEPLSAQYHGSRLDMNASYIAEMARRKAVELYGTKAYNDGYRIYTTINSELQDSANKAVTQGLLAYDRRHGYRGAEQKLSTPAETSLLSQYDEEPNEATLQWYNDLQTPLKSIPIYAKLRPAVAIAISEKSAKLLLANGTIIEIPWEQGLSEARPYINARSRGPKPKTAAEVLALGDVVRVMRDSKSQWRLQQLPAAQAALVSLNPRNGAILSLVGGIDFDQSNFNRAIQAKRQPGSNFKPFLYTAALENDYTAATIINDAPIVFDDRQLESTWRPENSNNNFLGPTRLRKALYRSQNLVSIRILKSLGISTALEHIDRFGLNKDDMQKDLSLALGSHAMTPLEVVTGYAVFANGGYKIEPYFIERILNFEGESVYEALPLTVCHSCESDEKDTSDTEHASLENDIFNVSRELKAKLGILEPQDYPMAPRVIDSQVAYIMDSILKDVVKRGTGIKAKKLRRSDIAGKTGTTNNATDAWFSGYGGGIVTTAWMGFDQITTLGREYGSSAALPIWMYFMKDALKGRPESTTLKPPGLVTVRINPQTGKRAKIDNPDAIFEVFRQQNVPGLNINDHDIQSPWLEANEVSTDSIF